MSTRIIVNPHDILSSVGKPTQSTSGWWDKSIGSVHFPDTSVHLIHCIYQTPWEKTHCHIHIHKSSNIHLHFVFRMWMQVNSPTCCWIHICNQGILYFFLSRCLAKRQFINSSNLNFPGKWITFGRKSKRIQGHWLLISLCLLRVCGGKNWTQFVANWMVPTLPAFKCG